MVAEIPNKNCLDNTPEPLRSQIIKARSDFDDWANGPNKHFPQKVRITGVGFFDTLGHATGTSPNGIELQSCNQDRIHKLKVSWCFGTHHSSERIGG